MLNFCSGYCESVLFLFLHSVKIWSIIPAKIKYFYIYIYIGHWSQSNPKWTASFFRVCLWCFLLCVLEAFIALLYMPILLLFLKYNLLIYTWLSFKLLFPTVWLPEASPVIKPPFCGTCIFKQYCCWYESYGPFLWHLCFKAILMLMQVPRQYVIVFCNVCFSNE